MPIAINSKILLSLASIIAAAALVIGATFAFFSDQETSNNNVFAAGTLDLVLCDDDENILNDCPVEEGPEDSVIASFGAEGLAPGGPSTQSGFIELKNTGSIDIAEVKLSGIANTTNDNGDGGSIVSVINTTVRTGTDSSCSGSTDQTPALAAVLGNGVLPLTLAELGSGTEYDALPGIVAGSSYFLCLDVAMDSSAGNEVQGDEGEIDLTFTANQDVSQ